MRPILVVQVDNATPIVVPTTKSIGLPIASHRTSRATRVRVPDRNTMDHQSHMMIGCALRRLAAIGIAGTELGPPRQREQEIIEIACRRVTCDSRLFFVLCDGEVAVSAPDNKQQQ